MTRIGHEVRLASRPEGEATAANFSVAQVELPTPRTGQVVVRTLFFSVDPYMRSRMDEAMVHMDPFRVGAALDGAAVGEVVESRSPAYRAGDLVAHGSGWRDLAVLPADGVRPLAPGRYPASAYLGVLGMPGMTAWHGLHAVGRFQAGQTVFVSGGAGAVGSTVGQLVKHGGGVVVASTGSAEKARWLREELGFDHVFNYRNPAGADLLRALPNGIDLYFDNVGGDQLELAIEALRPNGRIVACGMIAHADRARPGPANLPLIVGKRLSMTGFIVSDHYEQRPRFEREMASLVAAGAVRPVQTVRTGLESAGAALIGLLRGENVGKMLVAP